jgi:hypothetical protein
MDFQVVFHQWLEMEHFIKIKSGQHYRPDGFLYNSQPGTV